MNSGTRNASPAASARSSRSRPGETSPQISVRLCTRILPYSGTAAAPGHSWGDPASVMEPGLSNTPEVPDLQNPELEPDPGRPVPLTRSARNFPTTNRGFGKTTRLSRQHISKLASAHFEPFVTIQDTLQINATCRVNAMRRSSRPNGIGQERRSCQANLDGREC
jgi:hypothetical protein